MPVARIPLYRETRLGTHPAIGDVLHGAETIASWRCSVGLRETIRRQSHRCGDALSFQQQLGVQEVTPYLLSHQIVGGLGAIVIRSTLRRARYSTLSVTSATV